MKTMEYLETISVCDLKVSRGSQLIALMKVFEYSSSRSYLTLDPDTLTQEI